MGVGAASPESVEPRPRSTALAVGGWAAPTTPKAPSNAFPRAYTAVPAAATVATCCYLQRGQTSDNHGKLARRLERSADPCAQFLPRHPAGRARVGARRCSSTTVDPILLDGAGRCTLFVATFWDAYMLSNESHLVQANRSIGSLLVGGSFDLAGRDVAGGGAESGASAVADPSMLSNKSGATETAQFAIRVNFASRQ